MNQPPYESHPASSNLSLSNDDHEGNEKAEFVENQVNAYFAYTIDAFISLKNEGNNLVKWHFGIISTSVTIAATCAKLLWIEAAVGATFLAVMAFSSAVYLLSALKSKDTQPPGYQANQLSVLLIESAARMRWRAALGVDERIERNRTLVTELAIKLDEAKDRMIHLPFWGAIGCFLAWVFSDCLFAAFCS